MARDTKPRLSQFIPTWNHPNMEKNRLFETELKKIRSLHDGNIYKTRAKKWMERSATEVTRGRLPSCN